MKRPSVINQTTVHVLAVKYKPYIVPAGVILACFSLIVFLIIPQFQNWQASNQEAILTQQKLDSLNRNLTILSKIDTEGLNGNLQLAVKAVPNDKNFPSIINAITQASIISSVILDDYTFQVGDLGSSETNVQSLQLVLTLKGNAQDVSRFIHALDNQLPFSEVTDIQISNNNSAQLTVVFYYEPFPKLTFDTTQTLAPLTSNEEATLQTLQQRASY